MRVDIVHAHFFQELHRCAEANHLAGHLRARFKACWRLGKGGLFHLDDLNHRATGQERWQLLEQLILAVEHTNAAGATHLVAGKGREIHVQSMEINRHVWHRLAGVEDDHGVDRAGAAHQFIHVCHSTRHIGLMSKRNYLDGVIKLERIEIDASVFGHGIPLQRSAGASTQLLPRHQVGVVLQFGDDNGIALAHVEVPRALVAKHIGNFVQGLSGVFGKGDVVAVRAHKCGDSLTRGLVGIIGLFCQLIGTAVNRGVRVQHKLLFRLPYRQRALGGSTRIQVHQWLIATHRALENRELFPNCVYIKSRHESSLDSRG